MRVRICTPDISGGVPDEKPGHRKRSVKSAMAALGAR